MPKQWCYTTDMDKAPIYQIATEGSADFLGSRNAGQALLEQAGCTHIKWASGGSIGHAWQARCTEPTLMILSLLGASVRMNLTEHSRKTAREKMRAALGKIVWNGLEKSEVDFAQLYQEVMQETIVV